MKKIIALLATVVLGCNLLNAQVAPKYRELKKTYNPPEYVKMSTDPYSPIWAGAASFLMPGLGQMVCDEVGRGIAFFASEMALAGATAIFKGAAHPNAAKLWIEYALSPDCVELGASNGSYQFLVIDNATQPQIALDMGVDPNNVMDFDFADMMANTATYKDEVMKALGGGDDRFKTE